MDKLLEEIVILIADELKKTPLGKSVDVSLAKDKLNEIFKLTMGKLDQNSLTKIQAYLKDKNVISGIVNACVDNIQKILLDGKINLDDTSYFIDLIRQIYVQVDTINQNNINLKINS